MITEIVTFKLPDGTTREQVISNFEKTAPGWGENPDLIRKYYLYDAKSNIASICGNKRLTRRSGTESNFGKG